MTRVQLIGVVLAAAVAASVPSRAQQPPRYRVPRTEYGHPDFQGVWATRFLTMLERPHGIGTLVAQPDQAKALVAAIRANVPSVVDPDFQIENINQLARVKGELRTSIIVDPPDGKMPFTKAGLELSAAVDRRFEQDFDGPESRPLVERCLENLNYAPIRTVPVLLPRQIVQTRDHVLLMAEDAVGLRVINLKGQPPPANVRSVEGYSAGRWEGDTLVVETTHLRAAFPARDVIGRPLVISPNTRITERFTRASDTELVYRFTVEDRELYARPWTGEFSMTRHDGPLYEYSCHEGNYSLPNILRGGQMKAPRKQP